MRYRLLLCVLAATSLARPALAQCPDGTPPPCRRASLTPSNSIAVLTFDNVSRDTSDAYLAEGLANDISARLAQVERLTVTSRTMVRRLPNSAAMTPQAMGRSLAANYLVNGGIQRAQGRLHVSVELLRAATGQTVWSSQFDRTTADLLEAARGGAALLVVDLDSRRLPWAEALASLRADPALATLPVIGFLSHVNADAARKARDVGGCQILARSAFVRDLPHLLAAAAPPAPLELK